jgi:S1-C subfamily serine protease
MTLLALRQRIRLGWLALAASLVASAAVAVSAATAGSAQPPISTGVVAIDTNLAYGSGESAGTGMVLTASGEVLTNNHVIRGATTIRVADPRSGRSYPAHVLGYDIAADVALLELDGASGLQPVSIGNSATLRPGQTVTAIGNVGGTGTLTTTRGTITRLNRSITVGDYHGGSRRLTKLIETNAALRPGNSGGPLLDGARRVIGINTAASAQFVFRRSENDGYAIPINRALKIVRQIEAGRPSATVHIGDTVLLGVQLSSSDDIEGAVANGAVVTGVLPESPAGGAGLAPGDVITSIDGHVVDSPSRLTALLIPKQPGDTVRLAWADQYGDHRVASVTLGSGPPQ